MKINTIVYEQILTNKIVLGDNESEILKILKDVPPPQK